MLRLFRKMVSSKLPKLWWLGTSSASPQCSKAGGSLHSTPATLRFAVLLLLLLLSTESQASRPQRSAIRTTQQKVVKIYGAGGLRQMEAYQTGILVSLEGHVLTSLSYVLDTDDLAVVLDNGQKFQGDFVASDPVLELALLKLPTEEPLPAFNLSEASDAEVGTRVLAVSNLYGIAAGDEPVSVLHGVVTAIAPLSARRGRFQTNYSGEVYLVDANSNNPGAAGGALVDWRGQLLGILGKELRSEVTGGWLHYAIPVADFAPAVADMRAGRTTSSSRLELPEPEEPITLADLGVALVPEVVPRTPPYIDAVLSDSPAAKAGLRMDDLIVFLNTEPVASCDAVYQAFRKLEARETVRLSVLRDGELLEFELSVLEMEENTDSPRSTLKILDAEPTENEPSNKAERSK